MIIYRPHRGSLSDAMAEARVFANEDEMKRWIVDDSAKAFGKPLFSVDDIVIGTESVADSRNGWNDARYVCVKRYGGEVYPVPQCIGMCATKWASGSDYISRADAREYVRHAYAKGLNLVGYVDEVPAADVVSRDAFNRILAENDDMRAMLAQIGKKPGDSVADVRPVVLCRDCIYAPTGNQDGADLEWPCDDFPERNPCPQKCEDKWYSRKPAPDFFCANGKKLNT